MARGGYRPGAGRPRGSKTTRPELQLVESVFGPFDALVQPKSPEGDLSPLDFLLRVMRDPHEMAERRDKAAALLLPYLHSRRAGQGKKEVEAERARKAGSPRLDRGPMTLSRCVRTIPRTTDAQNQFGTLISLRRGFDPVIAFYRGLNDGCILPVRGSHEGRDFSYPPVPVEGLGVA
jgi:phage terminase small subunit